MGKKKFINKKNAATFELCPRDTSDPRYSDAPGGDKIFLRVDQNPVNIPGFEEEEEDNSQFDDAPEDLAYGYSRFAESSNSLPPHVRKEILELGFPDDGYNYLEHIREIKNTGGGSNFYANPKYEVDPLRDVKAYDASRVEIPGLLNKDEVNENTIYKVADKTVNVRVKKASDPEVVALLENSDEDVVPDVEDLEDDVFSGDGDSEEDYVHGVGDLEEDFVIQASYGAINEEKVKIPEIPVAENPRIVRPIDEQLDQLQLMEYGSDSDDNGGYIDGEEEEEFVDQNVHSLIYEKPKDYEVKSKYMNPADTLKNSDSVKDKEELESAAKINRRCVEYAENFNDEFVEIVEEESSDESEKYDAETIVSTYSNLDNHPGKISAPERARKKKIAETLAKALSSSNGKIITLQGKERLPVEFLPGKKTGGGPKMVVAKSEAVVERKSRGEETKEEKKERKNAVKSERREARKMKKETKELYRGETQRGQRAVAVSGPSSIHL